MVVVLRAWGATRPQAVGMLGAVLGALAVLDLVRLSSGRANRAFFVVFRRLATPREADGVASSTWYAAGMLVAVALFPRGAALSGILVVALADPVASYVGRRWGRRPFLGATLEGTGLFLAVALAVLAAGHPPVTAVAGAVVATLAERFHGPLDDNFAVPVATAAVLAWLGAGPGWSALSL